MAAAKEEINLDVKISPYQEMKPKYAKFLQGHKQAKKVLSDWPIRQKVEVDPTDWNAKSLGEAVRAVARYELKVFDMRMAKAVDEFEKNKNLKGEIVFVGAVKKDHATTGKLIANKVKKALNDLEKGTADDAKLLKDGKAALGKLDEVDFDSAMGAAAWNVEMTIQHAGAAEEPEEAMPKSLKDAKQEQADYAKTMKIGRAAIAVMRSFAKKAKGAKNASAELKTFGADIAKLDGQVFKPWLAAVDKLDGAIDAAVAFLGKGSWKDAEASKLRKALEAAGKGDKLGQKAQKELRTLSTRFKKLEKELK